MLTMVLLTAGCTAGGNPAGKEADPLGHYSDPRTLVKAVERGEVQAEVFVQAVKKGPIRFEDVSPRALANYLEAFAWERMLDQVPAGLIENEEMILSFETVFEDSRNVFNNWKAYKAFLKKAYHADVG
jgi:hypothetical protein